MRLIDADELLKQIKYKPIPNIVSETWNELYERVIEEIDNAPTVEQRPQGKWIFKHNSSDIWCSVCDENFDEIPQKFNYCPNCGADMRGNNNEH